MMALMRSKGGYRDDYAPRGTSNGRYEKSRRSLGGAPRLKGSQMKHKQIIADLAALPPPVDLRVWLSEMFTELYNCYTATKCAAGQQGDREQFLELKGMALAYQDAARRCRDYPIAPAAASLAAPQDEDGTKLFEEQWNREDLPALFKENEMLANYWFLRGLYLSLFTKPTAKPSGSARVAAEEIASTWFGGDTVVKGYGELRDVALPIIERHLPAAAAPVRHDDYVAWLRYDFTNEQTTGTTIRVCDSDAKGAFKVYRAPVVTEEVVSGEGNK